MADIHDDDYIRYRIGLVNTSARLSSPYAAAHNCDVKTVWSEWLKQAMDAQSRATGKEYSQYQLAKDSKVPQGTISRILDGTSANPRTPTLRKLADALSVAPPQVDGHFDRSETGDVARIRGNLSPMAVEVARRWQRLSRSSRAEVLRYIELQEVADARPISKKKRSA